jgi:heme A synthase
MQTLYRIGAALLLVLVIVQAAMAGQFLFGDGGIDLHGMVGNVAFAVATATAVLAFVARASKAARWTGVIMVVLFTAQLGLGYSSRSALMPASLHIPLGVIIFGVAVYQLVLAWPALVPRAPDDSP